MRSVQSKGEITAHSKTSQQSLTNAETEVVCVVTKSSGENSSAEELGSRCCGDGVRTLRSNEVMDYKLNGESTTMSSECEERQRF